MEPLPSQLHCQDSRTSKGPNPFVPTSSEGEGGPGSGLQTKASFRRSSMPLFITLSSLGWGVALRCRPCHGDRDEEQRPGRGQAGVG